MEWIFLALTWLMLHWSEVLELASAIVFLASIITSLIPGDKDDKVIGKVEKVLSYISINRKVNYEKLKGIVAILSKLRRGKKENVESVQVPEESVERDIREDQRPEV